MAVMLWGNLSSIQLAQTCSYVRVLHVYIHVYVFTKRNSVIIAVKMHA